MDSPRLSAGGLRFLDLPVPAVELSLSSEDRRAYWTGVQTTTGLPRFAPVRYGRGGCFLYSGVRVSLHETGGIPVPRQAWATPVDRPSIAVETIGSGDLL